MDHDTSPDDRIAAGAALIREADALLIGAGAGMGVDSGLPDFRGPEGFWRAYPMFRGKRFEEMSNPYWFDADPTLAWGFFGHRLQLYRQATPHAGFACLRRWGESKPGGHFVFTSNVDGQFQMAGFENSHVLECHGSIHFLQCTRNCGRGIWPAEGIHVDVDEATIRATSELPRCPGCGRVARPNILMFSDWQWDPARSQPQSERFLAWRQRVRGLRVAAIELGAGTAIPTVREECEQFAPQLIRINPCESHVVRGGIGIPVGAMGALLKIDALLS